ncbi:hypothetical protein HDF26_004354 [Pedobacter cryoconitis]|nr:hypothetical protein [Pedobacter cryoconitis]
MTRVRALFMWTAEWFALICKLTGNLKIVVFDIISKIKANNFTF